MYTIYYILIKGIQFLIDLQNEYIYKTIITANT